MDCITRRLECRCPVNSSKTMTINISNIVNRESARWLVLALVALMTIVPLYVFVPLVQDLFAISDIIPLVVWLALSISSVYISYKA